MILSNILLHTKVYTQQKKTELTNVYPLALTSFRSSTGRFDDVIGTSLAWRMNRWTVDCISNQWYSIEHAYNVIIARRVRDGDHSMQSSKQKYLYSHCRLTPRWAGEHMNAPDKDCCRLRFVIPNNLHVTDSRSCCAPLFSSIPLSGTFIAPFVCECGCLLLFMQCKVEDG